MARSDPDSENILELAKRALAIHRDAIESLRDYDAGIKEISIERARRMLPHIKIQ